MLEFALKPVRVLSVVVAATFITGSASSQNHPYKTGQLWECTARYEKAPEMELLQFSVTGVATNREVSRRLNFQNDRPVISVALVDLHPETCERVRHFYHLAFSASGLDACAPKLLDEQPSETFLKEWKVARDARGKWLISMQKGRGKVIDLNPSRFLALLRRMRCPD